MELEGAMNKLVDLVVKEYIDTKKELEAERTMNETLEGQNHLLYTSKEKYVNERIRLKELLSPAMTWANGKPMCISLFKDETLKELCELLGIEEHPKAML